MPVSIFKHAFFEEHAVGTLMEVSLKVVPLCLIDSIHLDNSLLTTKIRGWINIKMSPYQYRKSHCGDKTVLRPSYLHNGISYTAKTTSLYWIRAQGLTQYKDGVLPVWGFRDHYVHAPSQWETMLHCNIVYYWLGTYTKWSQGFSFWRNSLMTDSLSFVVEIYISQKIVFISNSLWPGYTILFHWSQSTLVQAIPTCQATPCHCLNHTLTCLQLEFTVSNIK